MQAAFRSTTIERCSRDGEFDRPRPHDDHLVAQPQGGAVDQSRCEQFSGAGGAGLQRIFDFAAGQRADAAGDQARAEIAVGLQIMRRAADDGGMSGQIDRIGDDGGRGVGLRLRSAPAP